MTLALTRRVGEKIIIDGRIWVWLHSMRDGTARIMIDAPKEMSVHREEVIDKIKRHNEIKPIEKPLASDTSDSGHCYHD